MSSKGLFYFFSRQERVREAVIKGSLLNGLARGLGYLRLFAMATLLGFSLETDLFFLAQSLGGIFLIFAQIFDSVGVPDLVYERKRGEKFFRELVALLSGFTLLSAILVCALCLLLLYFLPKVPFLYRKHPEALLQLRYYFGLLIPYLFASFWFYHFGAILRAKRLFTLYNFGFFLYTFFMVLLTVVGLYLWRTALVLPVALSLAQILATLYLAFMARDYWLLKFTWNAQVKKLAREAGYLLPIYGILNLFVVVERSFATYLPVKCISALAFGFTLAEAPRSIMKLENILITPLSEARANYQKVAYFLKQALKLSLPPTLVLFLGAPVIIPLLFNYGAFAHLDLALTVTATKYYALALPFMILWPIFFRIYQIRRELKQLLLVSIIAVLVNVGLDYFFIFKFELGMRGLIFATILSYATLVLYSTLHLFRKD